MEEAVAAGADVIIAHGAARLIGRLPLRSRPSIQGSRCSIASLDMP